MKLVIIDMIALYNFYRQMEQTLIYVQKRVNPLIIAFENRHYEIVNILLNNGTDTSLACVWKFNSSFGTLL